MKRILPYLIAAATMATIAFLTGHLAAQGPEAQAPLASTFTYQGRLADNGTPISDTCDLSFELYDAATSGTLIGTRQVITAVAVEEGLFSVSLNSGDEFGPTPFAGAARWLAIAVRCPAGSGLFTNLSPRQPLTAAPYAHFSAGSSWSGLVGLPAGFADNVDDDTIYSAGNGLTLDGTTFAATGSPIQNVIIVAKSGGDFTSISAALASISDNSASQRYQIKIGPGDYSERVTMKPYVDLVGSGPNVTRVIFPGGSGLEVVVTADNAEMRDLTVINDGSGTSSFALGINNIGTAPTIFNVAVEAFGGSFNYAIYNQASAHPILKNVTSTATGGSSAVSMYHSSASSSSFDSTFFASDDTNGNGFYATGGSGPWRIDLVDSTLLATQTIARLTSTYSLVGANSMIGGGGTFNLNGGSLTCIASRNDSDQLLNENCASTRTRQVNGGAYALSCSGAGSELARAVGEPPEFEAIVSGAEIGRCQIDLGIDLDKHLWTASAATDLEPRLVTCRQESETILSCLQTTLNGDPVDGPIILVLY